MHALVRDAVVSKPEGRENVPADGNRRLVKQFISLRGELLGLALVIVRDSELAEDVVQDTYLAVVNRGGSYRPDRDFRRWARAVTRNIARNALRAERLRRARLVALDAEAAERLAMRGEALEARPERWVELSERIAWLKNTMDSCLNGAEQCIVNAPMRGVSDAVVSRKLGISCRTVRRYRSDATKKLIREATVGPAAMARGLGSTVSWPGSRMRDFSIWMWDGSYDDAVARRDAAIGLYEHIHRQMGEVMDVFLQLYA